ncbi:MAG TPA: hypothetical protein VGE72_06815 [Azospirillum sp.]
MARRVAVVTASDAGYFRLLQGLVLSLEAVRADVDVCVLDLGCTAEQLDWIGARTAAVSPAEWHFPEPAQRGEPAHRKALTVRAFMRDYFPGYEVYLWLDSDIWVQDGASVALYADAARHSDIAICAEVHGRYDICRTMANKHLKEKHFYYKHYFGEEVANRYCLRPMLNAGAFALTESSPYWEAYRVRLAEAVKAEHMNYSDQMSLNLAVWKTGGEALLPVRHNWLCNSAYPMVDRDTGTLVDHYYPHEPVGIVHLAGPEKLERFAAVKAMCPGGGHTTANLLYRQGDY